jgi:glycosyltransferase involved in cell wall biosynthesis
MTAKTIPREAVDTRPRDVKQAAPAVSIVVPCYNGGRFIDQLLQSLAQQTFRDFETIIVNDGSTDEATRAKLASLDPSIRVINQENRGLSGARNAGIAAAKSDFVLVLDCDDEIEPGYLAETVPVLREAPPDVAMVFTHARLGGSASGTGRRYFNPFVLLFANPLPSCVLLRKPYWQGVGGYDERMREGYEDWEFYMRLALAGFRGIEIPKPLYVYNISPNGMLLNTATRVHGKLWRYIRGKHAEAYRLPAILRLWWATRREKKHVTLAKALTAYALAILLPDSWFNSLFVTMRRWNLVKNPSVVPGLAGSDAPRGLSAPRAG